MNSCFRCPRNGSYLLNWNDSKYALSCSYVKLDYNCQLSHSDVVSEIIELSDILKQNCFDT